MINGVHLIIYSKNADADLAFFRDVLQLPNVDVGHGWLIFAVPPSELAVHPADENGKQEFFLMCEDIRTFIQTMEEHHIPCKPVQDRGWGLVAQMTLPGGGELGVYQPRHARPEPWKP